MDGATLSGRANHQNTSCEATCKGNRRQQHRQRAASSKLCAMSWGGKSVIVPTGNRLRPARQHAAHHRQHQIDNDDEYVSKREIGRLMKSLMGKIDHRDLRDHR
jgi:hypothetical protein